MKLGTVLGGFVAILLAFGILVWINNLGQSSDPVQEDRSGVDPASNQIHGLNPFDGESPDPPPHLEIDATDFDFDRMAVGDSRTHAFVVRNTGEGSLKLAQGPTTCKCTVGTLGQDEVPPGGSTEIALEWHPETLAPAFSQSATIFSNDPDPLRRELTLTVHGAVVPWATTFPNSTWRSSAVSEVEPTAFEFVVVSQLAESFNITGIETSSELVELTLDDVTPIPEDELPTYELARCAYRLSGRLVPGFPVGVISERVTVSTDLEQMPQIRLAIETTRIGPYQLVGPGWHGSMKLLQLGRFPAAEGKRVQLSFFAEEDGGAFQFTDVRIDPPVLDITWEEDPDFESEARKRIFIHLATLPDMSPARWVPEDPIHVTLVTNDPDVPEWEFSVALQAN